MNREEKFINYLEGLKTSGNAELLENITTGFKTLVEYRVGGTPAEKVVDIMESEDDLLDIAADDPDVMEDIADGDLDVPLDESIVKVREGLVEEDNAGGVSEENNAADVSPVLEVGEGEVKGQLSAEFLRAVDDEVEENIREMSQIIDRQKITNSPEEKQKYLNDMRAAKWREKFIAQGIDPARARGLMPSLSESLDDANKALLEYVDTAFGILMVDKSK